VTDGQTFAYAFKTEHLTRSFSGFKAVNDVTIEIPRGGVRAIIGPNGAGKTTFFNLLSGLLPPSTGRVFFEDRDITGLDPFQRARLGIARSFQISNIFRKLSVYENVRLAVQSLYATASPRICRMATSGDSRSASSWHAIRKFSCSTNRSPECRRRRRMRRSS